MSYRSHLLAAEDVGKLSKDAIGAAMTRRKDLFQGETPSITDMLERKRAEGVRATLIRQLDRKLGGLADQARAKIEAASERQLQAWTDAVHEARSLEAVFAARSRRTRSPRRRA